MLYSEFLLGIVGYLFISLMLFPALYLLLLRHYSDKFDVTESERNNFFGSIKNPLRAIIAFFAFVPLSSTIGTEIFRSQSANIFIVSTFAFTDLMFYWALFTEANKAKSINYSFPLILITIMTLYVCKCIYEHVQKFIAIYSHDSASTEDYLKERAERASREKFEAALKKVPHSEPEEQDKV